MAVDSYLTDRRTDQSDELDIWGNTYGNTIVHVNNTNPNGSSPNYDGIPVVVVRAARPIRG